MRIVWGWEGCSSSPTHIPVPLFFPLLFSLGVSAPRRALLSAVHAASLHPRTAPGALPIERGSAPRLRPPALGSSSVSGSSTAPVRFWLSAGTAPGRCEHLPFFLLHFHPCSSLSCPPPAWNEPQLLGKPFVSPPASSPASAIQLHSAAPRRREVPH